MSNVIQNLDADVVVVGAGIAGLTAAWRLAANRVVVLEAADRVGGRMHSIERGEYWLNFGAHLFGGDDTPVGAVARAFGMELADIPGARLGVAWNRTVVAGGAAATFPLRLPLSLRDRLSFARLGLRLKSGVKRLLTVQRVQHGVSPQSARMRHLAFENDRTLADFVGPLTPNVASILGVITQRTGASPETMAAGYGLTSFAQVWSPHSFGRNLVGGSARLPRAIAASLPDVRIGARVTRIVQDRDGVEVTYASAGSERRIKAAHVVVSAPAYDAVRIIQDLPAETSAALAAVRYGPFVSVAVLTDEEGPMPWDRNYAVATPGLSFGVLFNMASSLRKGPRQRGGSLMLFRGGPTAAPLFETSDDMIADAMITDLDRLFPGARAVVREVVVHRWSHGVPFNFVGRAALQGALTRSLGRIHLAGDYLEFPCMDAAVATADEASARVAAALAAERVTSA